jgi:Zn-dependent protease
MFSIDPRTAIVLLVGFIIAIAVHEFSHALAARLLGDRTAERAGRLTLNPIRHLDPFGTLLLVLTMIGGAPGIGWGKPVPVNSSALRYGRAGMAIVSGAGPFSNFVLATLFLAIATHVDLPNQISSRDVSAFVFLNLGLCAFNLLPISPLDGFGVALGLLPRPAAYALARLGQYGPAILLLLVFSASIIRISLLSLILDPVIRFLAQASSSIATAF